MRLLLCVVLVFAAAALAAPWGDREATCRMDDECGYHGFCSKVSRVCVCDPGYTTDVQDHMPCSYRRHPGLPLVVVDLLAGSVGATYFMLGTYGPGIIILIVTVSLFACAYVAVNDKKARDVSAGIVVTFFIWIVVIHTLLVCQDLLGRRHDANGHAISMF